MNKKQLSHIFDISMRIDDPLFYGNDKLWEDEEMVNEELKKSISDKVAPWRKQDNKTVYVGADFVYIGLQEGIDEIPATHLFNCCRCNDTIAGKNQSEHLQQYHYKRWYDIQQQLKHRNADNYNKFQVGSQK